MDSFELDPARACLRVRYMLPGIAYHPDADGTRIAPSPKLPAVEPASVPQRRVGRPSDMVSGPGSA